MSDELDSTMVVKMQALYHLLGDFFEYSVKRGEREKRRMAALKLVPFPISQ